MFRVITLILLLIAPNAWASCPDVLAPTEYTTSGSVKTTSGVVCSVTYSYSGVTAGDSINLYDSATAAGTIRLTLVASATAGTIIKQYPFGAYFGTAIFYKDRHSGNGTVTTDIQSF